MGLIDTHTHLEGFVHRQELETMLARARAQDVDSMITVGTSSTDWAGYRQLAITHPGVIHYTAGLHPCSVTADWPQEVAALEAFWSSAKIAPCAVGETGLDRFHLPAQDEKRAAELFAGQRAAFAAQLDLARQWSVPVVVHSRGAFAECVQVIEASGIDWARIVFHCFAEGPAEMTELRERGGYGSFTGILTYRNAESVRAAVQVQGLERLMVETDAPYLTPVPHRGKPNEPAYVRHTADFAAQLFEVPYERLAARTTATARRFYGLTGS